MVEKGAKSSSLGTTRCRGVEFDWDKRTYVMGIINVTPDSFSGDGLGEDLQAALKQAQRFVAEGVDIIDIGGESTRPTAEAISVAEELRRVIPCLELLARELKVPLSIDTYKLEVAQQALDAGASMINDVWSLKREPRLARLAAERGVPIILMSNQRDAPSQDIIPAVLDDLRRAMEVAGEAGVPWEHLIVDPGIGFGKTLEQNLELIHHLDRLKVLGRPILLGTSRKSVIGLALGLAMEERLEGTAATVAIGIAKGASIVRVHDVGPMVRVCRMSDAIIREKTGIQS